MKENVSLCDGDQEGEAGNVALPSRPITPPVVWVAMTLHFLGGGHQAIA